MATHSSILAWETPWTEEPGGLQSMGFQKKKKIDEHVKRIQNQPERTYGQNPRKNSQ